MNTEGRLEVKYKGQWGGVCGDRMWDLVDASVACSSLGLPKATFALRYREFGRSNGFVWLDRIQCSGSEKNLANCAHGGWGDKQHTCYYPANVVCGEPQGIVYKPFVEEL